MKLSLVILSLLTMLLSSCVHTLPVPQDLQERATLEARKGAGDLLAKGIELAVKGISSLISGIKQDKQNRGEFTQNLVIGLNKADSHWNYMVVHNKHNMNATGTRGIDWFKTHREFDIKIGGTIGYEVYMFKSGIFEHLGDGGFINWAYIGKYHKDGKKIIFEQRP